MLYLRTRFLLPLLACVFLVLPAKAQTPNHSYPRVGIFHFGNPAPAEWYANFDLVIVRSDDESFAREIKQLSPQTYVFGTRDWNRGAGLDPVPQEWRTYNSRGDEIHLYGATNFYTVNMSDFCKPSPRYDNKKFNEYLPGYILSEFDNSAFSGICTDGLWIKPRDANGDVDLDRNGKNDYDEHGENWVNTQWESGVARLIDGLRDRMRADAPLILNSGRFHDFFWPESNGLVLENHSWIRNFAPFKKVYENWMDEARKPHVLLYDGKGPSKVDFAFMRFLLGVTMFGDGYFSFSENDLHHYHGIYDEYFLDLGFPTGEAQPIGSPDSDERGVWVRFFTKGAMIVNVDDRSNNVSDGDLRSVPGYDGPYFRFKGGQDPGVNNGAQFSQISLTADGSSRGFRGDAIFLTKEPFVSVADIYLDNDDEGTTPGSKPASLKGSWQQDNDNNDRVWTLSARGHKDAWAVAYTTGGSGNATARFTPNIGVPGKYHVYEWHGDIEGASEASNVPYQIRHAGGTDSGTINQSSNQGKWNYLGEFQFAKGESGYIEISNDANGVVVADAFKLVFADGTEVEVDITAPKPPVGIRIQQ